MAQQISKDQFISAFKTAPRAVRESMESTETLRTIDLIRATYNLHVDVTGQISKLIGYMLLGLVAPNAFYQNLLELGVTSENATAIVKVINEQIFLPLRDRLRQGADVEAGVEEDEEEGEYNPNVGNFVAVSAPQKGSEPQVPLMQVPVHQEARPTLSAPVAPVYNLARADALVPAPEAKIRTMQSDIAGLEHSSQMTPASIFRTASVPFTSNQNLPRPAIERQVAQPSTQPQTPSITQSHQTPIVRGVGADPYREPV